MAIRLQPKFKHPVGFTLLLRDQANRIFAQTARDGFRLDVSDPAVFVFPVRQYLSSAHFLSPPKHYDLSFEINLRCASILNELAIFESDATPHPPSLPCRPVAPGLSLPKHAARSRANQRSPAEYHSRWCEYTSPGRPCAFCKSCPQYPRPGFE